MKVGAIIQARMSSSRLPGKSLMEIEGNALVWHVVERLKKAKQLSVIILATSTDPADGMLNNIAAAQNIEFYAGDLNDVLDRYYQAAKKHKLGVIVRITGDCPLIDPYLLDESIKEFQKRKCDYLSNSKEPWADGFDIEVFTFEALENAWKNAKMASEREHVTPYIRNNAATTHYIPNDPRLEKVHCSVDKIEDLEFVRRIYAHFLSSSRDHEFTQKEVIELLEKNPDIKRINQDSIINEGYAKSLKNDKKVK